jgi:hypothetical protein
MVARQPDGEVWGQPANQMTLINPQSIMEKTSEELFIEASANYFDMAKPDYTITIGIKNGKVCMIDWTGMDEIEQDVTGDYIEKIDAYLTEAKEFLNDR